MAKVATSTERLNQLFDSDPHNDTEIADLLGVSKQTISAWRSGMRSPKKSMMTKIADQFHISELWLYGWDVENPRIIDALPSDETSNSTEEYIHLFLSLSKEKQNEAIRYIRYLLLNDQ